MKPIPYSRQDITDEDVSAVVEALKSDFITQGPTIGRFEEEFARRHAVGNAIAVCNATAGLHMACLALGVGPGTWVWTSPNSFLASANCALYCGASIDFVDIDPHTRNISIAALASKLEVAKLVGKLPIVVVPVDFGGLPCDFREMRQLSDQYGFKILEDASHATGAYYEKQPTGSNYVHASVFSFHAVKIVTTAEGGIVTTQDQGLAQRLQLFRSHGMTRQKDRMERLPDGPWSYEQQVLGWNYRMTEVQAALGLSQLKRLDSMRIQREALAQQYDVMLDSLPLLRPARFPNRQSAWHLYVVEIDDTQTKATRADVFRRMREAGVGVNVHYIPIHTQPFYSRLGFERGDFPASERYYSRAMSIPMFPALTEDEQSYVVATLKRALS